MHTFPRSAMRVMLGMATRDAGMISPAALGLGAAAGDAAHTCRAHHRVCQHGPSFAPYCGSVVSCMIWLDVTPNLTLLEWTASGQG